jgi:hypothetical protein
MFGLMAGGSKLVGWFFGAAGFVIMMATCGTLLFQRWDMHNAKLEKQGYAICTADYVAAERKAAAEKAEKEWQTATDLLDLERETVGALRNEYDELSSRYAELAASSSAQPSIDPDRCLSDGVLSRLRGAKPAGSVEGRKPAAGIKPGA